MFMTHIQLIMLNQTTVESMAFRTMKEREQATLAKNHGLCDIRYVNDLYLGRIDHNFLPFCIVSM